MPQSLNLPCGPLTYQTSCYGKAIDRIARYVLEQLYQMALQQEAPCCFNTLRSIRLISQKYLTIIFELAQTSQINPFSQIRLTETDGLESLEDKPLRVGFFPISADPLHWGHVLCALCAMALMKLDKIVFVIAGFDPRKPSLSSVETRHQIARDFIGMFDPLFAYLPIARGTDLCGEKNVVRLLNLNPDQNIKAFYIAGTDHYRRFDGQGEPDTIQKLEAGMSLMGTARSGNHEISALFLPREKTFLVHNVIDTFLKVHILPAVPIRCSSTEIRNALTRTFRVF